MECSDNLQKLCTETSQRVVYSKKFLKYTPHWYLLDFMTATLEKQGIILYWWQVRYYDILIEKG